MARNENHTLTPHRSFKSRSTLEKRAKRKHMSLKTLLLIVVAVSTFSLLIGVSVPRVLLDPLTNTLFHSGAAAVRVSRVDVGVAHAASLFYDYCLTDVLPSLLPFLSMVGFEVTSNVNDDHSTTTAGAADGIATTATIDSEAAGSIQQRPRSATFGNHSSLSAFRAFYDYDGVRLEDDAQRKRLFSSKRKGRRQAGANSEVDNADFEETESEEDPSVEGGFLSLSPLSFIANIFHLQKTVTISQIVDLGGRRAVFTTFATAFVHGTPVRFIHLMELVVNSVTIAVDVAAYCFFGLLRSATDVVSSLIGVRSLSSSMPDGDVARIQMFQQRDKGVVHGARRGLSPLAANLMANEEKLLEFFTAPLLTSPSAAAVPPYPPREWLMNIRTPLQWEGLDYAINGNHHRDAGQSAHDRSQLKTLSDNNVILLGFESNLTAGSKSKTAESSSSAIDGRIIAIQRIFLRPFRPNASLYYLIAEEVSSVRDRLMSKPEEGSITTSNNDALSSDAATPVVETKESSENDSSNIRVINVMKDASVLADADGNEHPSVFAALLSPAPSTSSWIIERVPNYKRDVVSNAFPKRPRSRPKENVKFVSEDDDDGATEQENGINRNSQQEKRQTIADDAAEQEDWRARMKREHEAKLRGKERRDAITKKLKERKRRSRDTESASQKRRDERSTRGDGEADETLLEAPIDSSAPFVLNHTTNAFAEVTRDGLAAFDSITGLRVTDERNTALSAEIASAAAVYELGNDKKGSHHHHFVGAANPCFDDVVRALLGSPALSSSFDPRSSAPFNLHFVCPAALSFGRRGMYNFNIPQFAAVEVVFIGAQLMR